MSFHVALVYDGGGGRAGGPKTKLITPRNKLLLHATRRCMRSDCRPNGSSQEGGRGLGGGWGEKKYQYQHLSDEWHGHKETMRCIG